MSPRSEDMASRLSTFKNLVPEFEAALKAFQSSGAKFRVLKTVYPQHKHPLPSAAADQHESPRTLFILDSSFNPPSVAHRTLALSTLEHSHVSTYASPVRLLLLFAVMNADKAPSPAAFEQRLALMTIFAKDLAESISDEANQNHDAVPIDIGVTTLPYYTDKSVAIEQYGSEWYPEKTKHVHLVGFDTLTRFFAAKYYQKFDPPFSALKPYFDNGHRLRVTLRPDDEYGTVDEQKAFHGKLASGDLARDGANPQWADQVELVPPNRKTGVSSTKIRRAAKNGDWTTVEEFCTPGVAGWVRSQMLYAEDDRGAKMA